MAFVADIILLPPLLLAPAALALLTLLFFRYRRRLAGPLRTGALTPEGLDLVAVIVGFGAVVSFLKGLDALGDRYLAPVLPAAIAFLLVSFTEAARLLRRRLPSALVALVFGGLALAATLFLWRRARGVVDDILFEPNAGASLETILAEGYTICHAGYDTAYTLQFLSDERVRFIPHHSLDRNRKLSRELRLLSGPQCVVTDEGAVRRWLPSDAAQEGGPASSRTPKR